MTVDRRFSRDPNPYRRITHQRGVKPAVAQIPQYLFTVPQQRINPQVQRCWIEHGTTESQNRAQRAVDDLWRYTGELFLADDVDRAAAASGFGVDPSTLENAWSETVRDVLARAGLTIPDVSYMQRGGRTGRHTEHLGHLLGEMQILARSHPGASW